MRVRRARAPHIEPEAVVRAALEILDAEGLEHITLRKISSRIGVQAPALYWHFRDKQDITDDMAQAILVQGGVEDIKPPRDPTAWAEWLVETAQVVRRAMVSHRDGGRVVAGASFRARTLEKVVMLTINVLNNAGFDLLHASLAAATTIDYVWGYVIEEQAGSGAEPQDAALQGEEAASHFELDPLLEAIMKETAQLTATAKFDWGLRIIVSGLKSALADSTNKIKTKP